MGYSQGIQSNHIMQHHENRQKYRALFRAIDLRNFNIVLVYQALYGDMRVYARPIEMFDTWIKKPTGSEPRFRIVSRDVFSQESLIRTLLDKEQTVFHTEDEIDMVLVQDGGYALRECSHVSAV